MKYEPLTQKAPHKMIILNSIFDYFVWKQLRGTTETATNKKIDFKCISAPRSDADVSLLKFKLLMIAEKECFGAVAALKFAFSLSTKPKDDENQD